MGAKEIHNVIPEVFEVLEFASRSEHEGLQIDEIGVVQSVGEGTAVVDGLPNVGADEIIYFPNNIIGMAYNLDPESVGVILLDESQSIRAGDEVRRSASAG